jgi:hypothetical protein
MAALDREVAEEKAEAAEAEMTKLGEKISELELEVAVLKEENGESTHRFCRGVIAYGRQRSMRSLLVVWEGRGPRSLSFSWRSITNG